MSSLPLSGQFLIELELDSARLSTRAIERSCYAQLLPGDQNSGSSLRVMFFRVNPFLLCVLKPPYPRLYISFIFKFITPEDVAENVSLKTIAQAKISQVFGFTFTFCFPLVQIDMARFLF